MFLMASPHLVATHAMSEPEADLCPSRKEGDGYWSNHSESAPSSCSCADPKSSLNHLYAGNSEWQPLNSPASTPLARRVFSNTDHYILGSFRDGLSLQSRKRAGSCVATRLGRQQGGHPAVTEGAKGPSPSCLALSRGQVKGMTVLEGFQKHFLPSSFPRPSSSPETLLWFQTTASPNLFCFAKAYPRMRTRRPNIPTNPTSSVYAQVGLGEVDRAGWAGNTADSSPNRCRHRPQN